MVNNNQTDDAFDDLDDEKAQRRDEKNKPKMPVESAFLKQIPKIQEKRLEKHHPSTSLPREYSGQVGAGKYTNSTNITNNPDETEK